MRTLLVLAALGFVPTVVAQLETKERPALLVLPLSGTPYERGFQHGSQLKPEIAALWERWKGDTEKRYGVDLPTFVSRFLSATKFEEAARRHTPELLDEVRGIADGSELAYEQMLVWQCIDEIWSMAGEILREKCTVIGVDRIGDTPAFVAQNLDLPRWYHGYLTVLHLKDLAREVESYIITLPGVVGAAGMSNRRVAIGPNTLLQLRPCRDGLPVAFIIRGVLMQPDHEAALAFLHRVPHASGQNYTVGGPQTAPGFECSAGRKVRYVPYAGAPFTFHTNHPLANDDFALNYRESVKKSGREPVVAQEACPRFLACQKILTAEAKPDPTLAKRVLMQAERDGPVCNPGTYACFLMMLGEVPELHIAPGRPDRTPFEVLKF